METSTLDLDGLTGTIKKSAFEPDFHEALTRAESTKRPLALVCLDIDNFLNINESFGHNVGDLVLKAVGELLITETADKVKVYRYGGDEFYLIIPDTSREEALLLLERIRLQFAQSRSYGSAELEVPISVGISAYPIDGAEVAELMRKADQALYRAKKEGRSRVLLAYDEKMIPKTVHFTETQLERLSSLAQELAITEARLLREALDDLITKYTVNKIGV